MLNRLQEVLKELALHLAETIERDSKAVVDQVCQYHLGAPRSEQVETPSKEFSASCSDEVSSSSPVLRQQHSSHDVTLCSHAAGLL